MVRIRSGLVFSFIVIAVLGTTRRMSAQQDLIGDCARDCSITTCLPEDFTSGGLQQCFRRCRAQCERQIRTDVVRPKYYVLTLIYAPPGCTNASNFRCPARGSVTYAKESSTGSTTSVSSSFRSGTSLTVDRSFSFAGISLIDTSSSTGFTTSVQTTDSLTVSKSEGERITTDGNGDGIDHGQDLFVLLLNPVVLVQSLGGRRASWNMGIDGPSALPLPVSVSELRNPSSMPTSVAEEFRRRGFTNADFRAILALDPFANGGTAIDAARFARTRWSVPYRPPVATGCTGGECVCTAYTKFVKNDLLQDHTVQATTEYTASLTTHVDLLSLTDQDNFTFTSTNTQASRRGSTNSAEATIACPSPRYTGSPLIDIYWDTVYNSFMFAINTDPIKHEGRVLDQNGQPVRQEEVALTFDGKTHYTVTDDEGRYRFAGPAGNEQAAPTGQIVVRSIKTAVPLGRASELRVQIE